MMKRLMHTTLFGLILAGALTSRSLAAPLAGVTGAGAMAAAPEAVADADDAQYASGTKAMDEQRWSDAVTAFDRVVVAKGKRADAAMYWKAYSLNKLGRREEAGAICGALRGQHPDSTWNKECRALQMRAGFDGPEFSELTKQKVQMALDLTQNTKVEYGDWNGRSSVYVARQRTTTDDDIKILALHSLMQQDPARALPLLRDLIKSDKSLELRKQALFVLSRSKQPEAQSLLAEVAMNKSDPAIQREAVMMLGMRQSKEAGPKLVEIYRSSADAGVKRAAVNGLFLAHDAPRLVDLARGEKDLNQKRDIVSQLALMKDPAATDYMLELLK